MDGIRRGKGARSDKQSTTAKKAHLAPSQALLPDAAGVHAGRNCPGGGLETIQNRRGGTRVRDRSRFDALRPVVPVIAGTALMAVVAVLLMSYDGPDPDGQGGPGGIGGRWGVCDAECAWNVDPGYACALVAPGEYVCRPPRDSDVFGSFNPDIMFAPAIPSDRYGEIELVAEDAPGNRAFGIGHVNVANYTSGEIRLDLVSLAPGGQEAGVADSARLYPGDVFVQCIPGEPSVGHVIQYTDLFELDGVVHAEFWGVHPRPGTSPLSQPCDAHEIVKILPGRGHDPALPGYGEFSFG